MSVLSDDFAAVDFGEELCQTQPPEKANSRGTYNGKETNQKKTCAEHNQEKACAGHKRQPISKQFSRNGSTPPRLSMPNTRRRAK